MGINPICWVRAIWRSLRCGAFVSGHDYATIKEPTPPNIHIIRCDVCGHESLGWSWTSMEDVK